MNVRLARAVLTAVSLPLYALRFLIPADKTLWLFGAWFGLRYADNSRHLYEATLRSCPDIRAVWLSRSHDVRRQVRAAGGEAVSPWSVKGVWLSLRAGCGIVSNSAFDLNGYLQPRRMFNMWHGFPLKRIRNDDPAEARRSRVKRAIGAVLPNSTWRMDLGLASLGAVHAELLASGFEVDLASVRKDGYPRNDCLVADSGPRNGVVLRVMYLPTFRDRSGFSPLGELATAATEGLDDALAAHRVELLVRPHPVDGGRLPTGLKAIKIDESGTDVHLALRHVDILVTDYSSIYVDFLLTQRPIIFAPFDLGSYLENDRPMYFRYDDVTPGPKCWDWTEVLRALLRFTEDPNWYRREREELRDSWHDHVDGGATTRTLAYLRTSVLGSESFS